MSIEGFKRKLTAILSADVKGYSRLMGEDEVATVRTLTAYREAMTTLVEHHRGRVVDSPGDNILAEFASVVDAVQCAVEIQQVLKARNAQLPENRRMEFRIGINLGDVIEEEGRIYGDGVNIAARLEGLAEPGGICISGTVYEHVRSKLTLWNEYLGEHSVKNIVEPVRVYRVLLEPEAAAEVGEEKRVGLRRWRWAVVAVVAALVLGVGGFAIWNVFLRPSPSPPSPPAEVVSQRTPTLELPDRPSVAVLPFDNMSGDPEQEYFSDGLTEDLITDLSKISGLFVIARNSVFVYKGQAVDIQEVGQELGVRYVVEGSVRKANGTVRITAQLIDASTGGHLWAERYDRDLEDIFALQDDVVEQIVAALAVTLTEDEQESLVQNETDDLEAYDYAQRGWWYYHQLTKETNDQARVMFERAIDLDPQYAGAHAGLGFTYYEEWAELWSQDPQSLERAFELATQALALDDSYAGAYTLLSHVYLWRMQHEQAIAELERALALEPNNADYHRDLAEVLVFAGRPQEAVGLVEDAMRLNPRYPATYPFTLGFAHAYLGFEDNSPEHFEQAIAALKEAIEINPNLSGSHLIIAYAYYETGQEEEARNHIAQALEINPQLSVEALRGRIPFKDQGLPEAITDALRKTGLN
jgi:adenylate cyclase